MILSVSAVGASDIVDNQDVSTSSQIDMLGVSSQEISNSNSTFDVYENNAKVLSADASNNNLLGADDGSTGSYNDLTELIKLSSGTLTLQSDYEYKGSGDVNSIVVSKSLIIDGNNHTINGNGVGGGFVVTADDVVVKNFDIVNVSSSNYAGAVYWTGHYGNLINVYIRNAVVTTGSYAESGGISWWGNDGIISGVVATNCTSKGSGRHGAALSCAGANLKIYDSIFYNITSGGSAYAGIAVLGSSSNVFFGNCMFNQIATGSYGMFFYEATSGLKFEKCNFSSSVGKIIFCRGSDISYTDCNFYCNNNVFSWEALHFATFKNCVLDSFSDICSSNGITGEHNVMRDNYYFNCTFVNCAKIYKPYVKSVDSYINSTFINCTDVFTQYSKPTSGYLIMENCSFINSSSASYDSVIAIMGGVKNTLIGNQFINSALSSDIRIYSGSAAYYNDNKRDTGDAVVLDNSGVSVNMYSELFVTENGSGTVGSETNPCNLTFALNNIAKDGVVHIANGTYNLYASTFNVNFIMDNDMNVTLTNGTLDVKNGYNIRHLSFSNLTASITIGFASSISNCTFIHNKVSPIYLSYTSRLYNCTFDDCNCTTLITHHTHGINSLDVELVTITRCTFTQFILTSEGGANAIFKNITVTNSTVGYIFVLSGSGVYLDLNDIKFSGIFIKNCNMTHRVFSYTTNYIRSLTYEHIVVEDCNYAPYEHVFLVALNTALRDVTYFA